MTTKPITPEELAAIRAEHARLNSIGPDSVDGVERYVPCMADEIDRLNGEVKILRSVERKWQDDSIDLGEAMNGVRRVLESENTALRAEIAGLRELLKHCREYVSSGIHNPEFLKQLDAALKGTP